MINPLRNVCFGKLCSVIVIALLNGCGTKIDAISTQYLLIIGTLSICRAA